MPTSTKFPILFHTADLVVLELDGGQSDDAGAAVCIDLEASRGYEWRALVSRSRVAELLSATRAIPMGFYPWDGSDFGDGNGGTVRADLGTGWRVVGDGLSGHSRPPSPPKHYEVRDVSGIILCKTGRKSRALLRARALAGERIPTGGTSYAIRGSVFVYENDSTTAIARADWHPGGIITVTPMGSTRKSA